MGYQGGNLVTDIKVKPIYWSLPGSSVYYPSFLDYYYQTVVSSTFMDLLDEQYSVPGQKINNGTFLPSYSHSSGSTVVTDAIIQAQLTAWVAAGVLPAPTPNHWFPIHFGPGITVLSKEGSSCLDFCSYHNYVDSRCAKTGPKSIIQYAVIVDTQSAICNSGSVVKSASSGINWGSPLAYLAQTALYYYNAQKYSASQTYLSSHEMAEFITDPYFDAWNDPVNGLEVADACVGAIGMIDSRYYPGTSFQAIMFVQNMPALSTNGGHCQGDSAPNRVKRLRNILSYHGMGGYYFNPSCTSDSRMFVKKPFVGSATLRPPTCV